MFARSTCLLLRQHISHASSKVMRSKNLLLVTQASPSSSLICLRREHQLKRIVSGSHQAIRTLWIKIFGKYLFATNVISSGVLMVIGDVLAQEINYSREETDALRYDVERLGRMFIVGALMGPIHHYGYIWMERAFPLANLRSTIWKILLDQIVMSPICLVTFFYSACYMESKTLKETTREFVEKFPFIYLMDWITWPLAQYVNFRYLDPKYRVIYVNVCTALYNIFLSYIKHNLNPFIS